VDARLGDRARGTDATSGGSLQVARDHPLRIETGLALARLPGRPLPGHDLRQAIQVGDDLAIDGLVEGEQPRLMGEQSQRREWASAITIAARPLVVE
jgi:hypothetical protein